MANLYGQIVIGPPGSGKTTYCEHMAKLLEGMGRKVAIVNIDPANENMKYSPSIDVMNLVTLDDVMTNLNLGPNGGLIYCMEFLEQNFHWLLSKITAMKDCYFIFDCPGQVELYTHHNSVRNIIEKLEKLKFRLCCVHLVDSHYCSDSGKFISTLLLSMSVMLNIGLPHVNVLSKADLMMKHGEKLQFGIDFYTEVLNLEYLLDSLDDNPITSKWKKLNSALVSLIEDYSLVSFMMLNTMDKDSLIKVKNAVDKANGFIFGPEERRSVQNYLECAYGTDYEGEKFCEYDELRNDE